MLDTIFPRNIRKLSALLAFAISVVLTTPLQAFSQGISFGELKSELVDKTQLHSEGYICEARNAGHLLEVWRGADNNRVWLSLDNGGPFTLGFTETFQSPTVVGFGSEAFLVMHVGVDDHIYYTVVHPANPTTLHGWRDSGLVTTMPVAAAQMNALHSDDYQVPFVVYRAPNGTLWGTRYDTFNDVFGEPTPLRGGVGNSAPSITYNPYIERLYAVVEGTDGALWLSFADAFTNPNTWTMWARYDIRTYGQPSIEATDSGTMVVTTRNDDGTSLFTTFDATGVQTTGLYLDTMQTTYPIRLTHVANTIYALYTIYTSDYYRQVYKHP
jgi:hypothetical protein